MKYLEVRPDQVLGAIASLSMLTPVEDEAHFGKPNYHEVAKVKQQQSSFPTRQD
jgi:hypothetical protein